MQHRASERELKVLRAHSGEHLDHVEATEIRGVTHRRSPVAAYERNMQQLRFQPDDLSGAGAIVCANRNRQRLRERVRADALL